MLMYDQKLLKLELRGRGFTKVYNESSPYLSWFEAAELLLFAAISVDDTLPKKRKLVYATDDQGNCIYFCLYCRLVIDTNRGNRLLCRQIITSLSWIH